MNQLPQARSSEIIEQEIGSELMIYDLQNNTAYSLNETSRIIYRACDGTTNFDELKRRYNFDDDLINFALDELNAKNLLEDYAANNFAGMNRREVIKKVGLASMVALPVIASIIAPRAANAASGQKRIGDQCTGGTNDPTCPTGRCSLNNSATFGYETCCIPENARNSYTCVNGDRDCCLGVSGCVNGTCCRTSAQTCTQATANLCCTGVCGGNGFCTA